MEGINIPTLAISLLALAVSAYTAYKNFFWSIELLFTVTYTGAFPKENHKYEPYIDLVVSNMGNMPGIIISLALSIVEDKDAMITKPETNWKKFLIDDKEITPKAFAIKGKDTVVKRVVFSEIDLREAFSPGTLQVERYAHLELGALDTKNAQKWKSEYLGHLWFQVDRSHPRTDHLYVPGTLVSDSQKPGWLAQRYNLGRQWRRRA